MAASHVLPASFETLASQAPQDEVHRYSNVKQQISVRILAAPFARGLHFVVPQKREQGMPGARCTRGLACKRQQTKAHTSIQVSGGNPAFPAQWFYGLYRALLGERIRVVTVAAGLM